MAKNMFAGKSVAELLELAGDHQPTSPYCEQLKMTIANLHVESIEKSIHNLRESMEKAAASNNNLSNKIFGLNIILTCATVLGVIIAYFEYAN